MFACDVLMNLHEKVVKFHSSNLSSSKHVHNMHIVGDVLIAARACVFNDGPLTRGDPGTFISSLFISLGGHDKMLFAASVWWIWYVCILITNGRVIIIECVAPFLHDEKCWLRERTAERERNENKYDVELSAGIMSLFLLCVCANWEIPDTGGKLSLVPSNYLVDGAKLMFFSSRTWNCTAANQVRNWQLKRKLALESNRMLDNFGLGWNNAKWVWTFLRRTIAAPRLWELN